MTFIACLLGSNSGGKAAVKPRGPTHQDHKRVETAKKNFPHHLVTEFMKFMGERHATCVKMATSEP